MTGILIRWLITTLAILVVPQILSGVKVDSFGTALFAGAILGILNALVRPVLILLTLPLTIVTLGIFILVINALMFQLAGALVSGLHIASFWSALFGSLIVSLVSWAVNSMIGGSHGERTIVVRRYGRQQDDRTIDMHQGKGGTWE